MLIGTESELMLLDRSGQGKVYQLISRRRFQQMEVLEGQNILITISGKKNRVRVYYLSWLKSKILRIDGVSFLFRTIIDNVLQISAYGILKLPMNKYKSQIIGCRKVNQASYNFIKALSAVSF